MQDGGRVNGREREGRRERKGQNDYQNVRTFFEIEGDEDRKTHSR